MREVERRAVRIDVCPECRGVWLDRGELEKLLAAEPEWEPGTYERGRPAGRDDGYRREEDHRREAGYRPYPYKKKRKGWLSEMFDFDFGD